MQLFSTTGIAFICNSFMGIVYRARDKHHDREVAITLLQDQFESQPFFAMKLIKGLALGEICRALDIIRW